MMVAVLFTLLARFTDLPEVRRLCGISGCPDCVLASGRLRQDIDHEAVRQDALRTMLRDGNDEAACAILAEAGLTRTHLQSDCPFLGTIAHLTPDCFPGDRLHLQ